MLKKLRKSSRVTLVLIGTAAALAGCNREEGIKRDVYASKADCLADWGNQPEDCTQSTQPSTSRTIWLGPYYAPHWYSGFGSWTGGHASTHSMGSVGSSSGSSSGVTRGGFGSSGSARGSSSS